jgi:sugar lactone lactonase YvrE
LWRLDPAGDARLMEDGLIAGNGIAWSPDDRTMYLADTLAGTVWQYDFDLAAGEIANRRLFVSTDPAQGAADGATVDADGCYWCALFRGGAVAQFDPAGRLVRRVELPVSNPTMCAFGGPDLDILYVTSASRFLDEVQLRAQPLAGRVLAVHGLGARGLPEPKFGA